MKAKIQNMKALAAANLARIGIAGVGLVASAGAMASGTATPPDFTQITSNVSFATVVTGVMAVAVLVAAVYVCISGAKIVLRFVKGA